MSLHLEQTGGRCLRCQEQGPQMIRTSILAAALLSATALVTVPAAAYTDDGGQGRQSRNWTGNQSGNTTSTTRTRRGTDSNQRDDTLKG